VVDVLVILDGASEPIRAAGTALERARTPVLDALGREGAVSRLRTVAPGLPAGSEAAIPALLGWVPPAPVDRGAVEAAARGIDPAPGERAWRVDVLAADGHRAGEPATAHAAASLAAGAPAHAVHRIGGHRLLVIGPPPLPPSAHARLLHTWPEGLVPPRVLDADVVVIAARGAAAGCARMLGASVVNPPGATGAPDTDLHAKAAAALAAIAGGSLAVCPDHGCDPATGEHDDEPVPHLRWPDANGPAGRLTERAVDGLPIAELHLAAVA
jgi:2,3-bisphosphoglycerate-independent phosphoglycerate mutase